tara:strand:+ start:2598 stop:3287 length:690 start_codon:yes stop_codon:yes gene_type:complete
MLPSKKTYYEVIGVDPKAEVAAIKKAYLKKARVLHPDNNRNLSKAASDKRSREMQELNIAWGIISDGAKRKQYDQSLIVPDEPAKKGFTYQDISEEFTAHGESIRKEGPEIATKEEMEIKGIAKLMRPIPLSILFVVVIGILIVGLVISGNSETNNPGNEYIPLNEQSEPFKCIDIVPVFEDVPCQGRHDAKVWDVIETNGTCGRGLEKLYAPHVSEMYCVFYSDNLSQ